MMEVVLKPMRVQNRRATERANRLFYDKIMGVRPNGSPFKAQIEQMKDYSDTWWLSVGYKHSLLRLMSLLADNTTCTKEKLSLGLFSDNEIVKAIRHAGMPYRISLNIESRGKIPFNSVLGAMSALATNLVEPCYSQGTSIHIGETYKRPKDLIVHVTGLQLKEGALAFRKIFEPILAEMGGTLRINGSFAFKVPFTK